MSRSGWKTYVPVAKRNSRAMKKMNALKKKGMDIKPVEIEGRKIARTFWGKAWCDHLESFSDYTNRLPRGRTYVRNGSVCHLDISRGEVNAMVIGSRLYKVKISIKTLSGKKWGNVKKRCIGEIGSLLELLQGKFSRNVMSVVTDRDKGLFPLPGEISMMCDCPDWAVMCKHVAAVLYGVGARLDEEPELLFLLRGVDHEKLIATDVDLAASGTKNSHKHIADDALADIFGIEMSKDLTSARPKTLPHRKKAAPKSKKASGTTPKLTMKRKSKTAKHTDPVKKTPAPQKTETKGTSWSVTGKAVAELRAKFGITQKDFAKLLGVSTTSIGNWEKKPGTLRLQSRTLNTWNEIKILTKRQALRKLADKNSRQVE